MDAKNLFWGLVLKPGKRYEQTVEESFHVSKACIEPTSASGKVASVYVEVDNEEFLLCSLINPAVLNENLDLNFSEEEKICFRVEGEGTVHLTGYLVPDDDIYDPSYAMSDDEEEEEEDEDLVERNLASLVKKRKISNGDSSPFNNAKKGKLSPSVKATKGSKNDAKSNEIKQAEAMKKILTAKKTSEEESDEDDSEAGSDDDSEDIEDMTMEYGEEEEEDSDEDLEGEEEEEGSDEGSEEEDEEEMEEDEIESSIEKEKKQTPAKKNSQKEGIKAVEGTPKNQKTPQGKGNKTPSQKETPKVQEKPLKESTETPSKSAKKNKNKNKNNESKSVSTPVTNGEGKAANRNGVTPSKGGKGDATPKAKTPMRTLKGGLMVEDLKVGDGPEATKGKMVGMYYEGRLKSNNKKFDEQKTGKHFRFRLGAGEVIKGWDAGVEGMKVGGKRRLTVPPNMAYGQQGALPEIPSNATLVFEVECKAVN